MSRNHHDREDVFAVLRHDPWAGAPELQVTVKEIVSSQELAAAEVTRLNQLNAEKGCHYFWQQTRLYPPGASAGTSGESVTRPAI